MHTVFTGNACLLLKYAVISWAFQMACLTQANIGVSTERFLFLSKISDNVVLNNSLSRREKTENCQINIFINLETW